MSIITDNTVLVQIYSGLDSKNKITLGLLVALTAEKNDHKVTLFLAGDGVQILNCKKAGEIVGQGTGDLYEHLQNLKSSKITIYVSGMSAKSRGYDEKLLDGFTAEFVMPDVLVEESIKADSVLCY
jgi:predicted peroxiredoxin